MNSFLESADIESVPVVEPGRSAQSLDSLPTDEFLKVVGMRVRAQRSTMSMSRKKLAEVSGVSERYLAQLESGQGNMSIALLRKVTAAIEMSLATLLSADTPELLDTNGAASDEQRTVTTADSAAPSAQAARDVQGMAGSKQKTDYRMLAN